MQEACRCRKHEDNLMYDCETRSFSCHRAQGSGGMLLERCDTPVRQQSARCICLVMRQA